MAATPPPVYHGCRYMALGSPYEDPDAVRKFYTERGIRVVVFENAAQLRDCIRRTMTLHPEVVCVVQNPPEDDEDTHSALPLGAVEGTIDRALHEVQCIHQDLDEDWTPMVVWFTANKEDAAAEVSLDHRNPTPRVRIADAVVPQLGALALQ